jgi:hypothetical protein
MIRNDRRQVLKGSAALAGTLAFGFPSIVRAQSDAIKIGHLTPLTGFLGVLGAYAQLGIKMAVEEINAAGDGRHQGAAHVRSGQGRHPDGRDQLRLGADHHAGRRT